MTRKYTPVENHSGVLVKREDLCSSEVPLSKIRGAFSHLRKRPEQTIVCLDTWRSLNGLVTAAVCAELGKKSILAYPVYKCTRGIPNQQVLAQQKYHAALIGVPAGRQRIMKYRLLRMLEERGLTPSGLIPGYHLMPDAFRLEETAEEAQKQYLLTIARLKRRPNHLVVPVGTGTHLKGLLQAVTTEQVWAVLGYSSTPRWKHPRLTVVNLNYQYNDADETPVPFPACSHYESKAWSWLQKKRLKGKVLFWNIGSGLLEPAEGTG